MYAKYDRFFPIDESFDRQQSRTFELSRLFHKRTELPLKNTVNFTLSLIRVGDVESKVQALMWLMDFESIRVSNEFIIC